MNSVHGLWDYREILRRGGKCCGMGLVLMAALTATANATPGPGGLFDPRTELMQSRSAERVSLEQIMAPGRATRADLIEKLQQSARRGDSSAQHLLGKLYLAGSGIELEQDLALAAYWTERAALTGNANAQDTLAGMYATGAGVPRDSILAAHWWRRAADQGRASAQFNLGLQYATGNGVPPDADEAVFWWGQAANAGSAVAQFNLGLMYMKGEGVDEDLDEALRLWDLSARQGFEQAVHVLRLFQMMR
jgi:TPR repeat protein